MNQNEFYRMVGRYTLDTSGDQNNNDLPQVLCKDSWTYVLVRDANDDSVLYDVRCHPFMTLNFF